MKHSSLLLAVLSFWSPGRVAIAQQFSRGATLFASSSPTPHHRPWRSSSTTGRGHGAEVSARQYFRDYNSYYIAPEDWAKERNARLYSPSRRRRINDTSISSRLTLVNIIAYLVQVVRPSVTAWGVKLSHKILAGQELYRLVTPMFLHGSLVHLFTNSQSLARSGPEMEHAFGRGRFLATYLVSGVTGNLVSAYMSPNPSLGASGAIFGVISAYYLFLNRNGWLLGREGEQLSVNLGATMLMNIALGYMIPTIDNWGHLGGAIGGAAMSYYFGPRLFYTDLPDGRRVIVDRPIFRLPRTIESLPSNVSRRLERMVRRMHVDRFKMDMPDKPWRPRRQIWQPPRDMPTRSVRPPRGPD